MGEKLVWIMDKKDCSSEKKRSKQHQDKLGTPFIYILFCYFPNHKKENLFLLHSSSYQGENWLEQKLIIQLWKHRRLKKNNLTTLIHVILLKNGTIYTTRNLTQKG